MFLQLVGALSSCPFGGMRGRGLVWRLTGSSLNGLLQSNPIGQPPQWVLAFKAFKLSRCVLVKELVDREVATTDSNLNLIPDAPHCDPLRPELIDTLGLSHEHNLELLAVRVVVNILCQFFVDQVVLDGDVDCDARLQIDDVLPQLLDLTLSLVCLGLVILHLLQHLQLRLL